MFLMAIPCRRTRMLLSSEPQQCLVPSDRCALTLWDIMASGDERQLPSVKFINRDSECHCQQTALIDELTGMLLVHMASLAVLCELK